MDPVFKTNLSTHSINDSQPGFGKTAKIVSDRSAHFDDQNLRYLSSPSFDLVVVVDKRSLERDCFVQCLQQRKGSTIVGFDTVAEAELGLKDPAQKLVILNNIGSQSLLDAHVRDELRELVAEAKPVPVVVLGTSTDIEAAIVALECGATGYIPPCVHFTNIVEAAHLCVAGGTFVPKSSLLALRRSMTDNESAVLEKFTERQLAVAQALRRGAANKTIAYELDLQESTVKVHIRHIFERLKVTNRTQAAFKLNKMTGWPDSAIAKGA